MNQTLFPEDVAEAEPVDIEAPNETDTEVIIPPANKPGSDLVLRATAAYPEPDFDWSSENPDLVCPLQPAIAIYTNMFNQIVIRKESTGGGSCDSCGDDPGDVFIQISRHYVPDVIRRLQRLLKQLEG